MPAERPATPEEQFAHDTTVLLAPALNPTQKSSKSEQHQTQAEALEALINKPAKKKEQVQPKKSKSGGRGPAEHLKDAGANFISAIIQDDLQDADNRYWLSQLMRSVNTLLDNEEPSNQRAMPTSYAATTQPTKAYSSNHARPKPQGEQNPHPDTRVITGQPGEGSVSDTFNQFAFGSADHAYVAGAGGLWQASLEMMLTSENGEPAAGSTEQVVLTTIPAEAADGMITLNGVTNQEAPFASGVNKLSLYYYDDKALLPVVSLPAATASGGTDFSQQLFAALPDNNNAAFATNRFTTGGAAGGATTLDSNGKFYDATETGNLAINQAIVTCAGAKDQSLFFAVVADGGPTNRAVYKRPDGWEDTIRSAVIDGMSSVKKNAGGDLDPNSAPQKAVVSVTPAATAPTPANAAETYTQCIIDRVNSAYFLSPLDADATDIYKEYANKLFRDAINLRKGWPIDLALAAATSVGAQGAATVNNIVASIATQASDAGNENIGAQANPASATQNAPDFKEPSDDAQGALAAAIQVALGRGVREIANAVKTNQDPFVETGVVKPFKSLDSTNTNDGDTTTDLDLYLSDQDGSARGLSIAMLSANPDLYTKDSTTGNFMCKPGKIITTAMYDGIDVTKAAALTGVTGALQDIGMPCALYSGADAYPASRAMITQDIDLYWDSSLQRLFVGFNDIALGDDTGYLVNGSGGACSVMVGQQKTVGGQNAFYLQPIIGPHFQSLLFQTYLTPDTATKKANASDYLIGFYQNHDPAQLSTPNPSNDLHAVAKKPRVMHTSTGKDYLLFNGGVAQQSSLDSLNSKIYALPLIASTGAANAGLIAQAERGTDFYDTGLKSIKFDLPVACVSAGGGTKDLSAIATETRKSASDLLANWAVNKSVKEAQAIFTAMNDDPVVLSGIASMTLESCYAKQDGTIPADATAAAATAYQLLQPGTVGTNTTGYNFDDANAIQKSWLIERTEELGLDKAVPALQGDRAKTEAPSYDVARFINEANFKNAAAQTTYDAVWTQVNNKKNNQNGAAYNSTFGAPQIQINLAAGTVNNVDAGGTAGGVAGIEGALAYSINQCMTNSVDDLRTAIQTMHADAGGYPAFDYVRVGANPQRLSYDTSAIIQDLWIVGDTVYVALGGPQNNTHTSESGVFASSAIFDATGFIRSWTPWQRVQGHTTPAGNIALDPTTSRFWSTTNKDAAELDIANGFNALNVTQWGLGNQAADATSDTRLSTALERIFGDIGGVFGFASFGPETQGFKQGDFNAAAAASRPFQFSMAVATGQGSVVLLQTGKVDTRSNQFVPTAESSGYFGPNNAADATMFNFDLDSPNGQGTALGQLGTITCSEISRIPLGTLANVGSTNGWLFVGGTNGLAVLTRYANGKGWNTATGQGLSALLPSTQRDNFPAGANWRWMQILVQNGTQLTNEFSDVYKITSDGSKYLYVLTSQALWRIDMLAQPATGMSSIFARQQVATGTTARANQDYTVVLTLNTHIFKLAEVGTTKVAGTNSLADKQFLDLMVTYRDATGGGETKLIVGTTAGLFESDNFADGNKQPTWTQLEATHKDNTGTQQNVLINKPAIHFDFTTSQVGTKLKQALVSATQKYYADGNLEVTALDGENNMVTYRFNLSQDGTWDAPTGVKVTPFSEPYHTNSLVVPQETTPYFYKIGSLSAEDVAKINFSGPLDYYARSANIGGSATGFANGIWMMPQPTPNFLRSPGTNDFEAIDLGLDLTLPLYFGNIVLEEASGTHVIPGEFGVRVSD